MIPIVMLTDSQCRFKVILKASNTPEKRLVIHIRAARDTYKKSTISDVGLIRSTL